MHICQVLNTLSADPDLKPAEAVKAALSVAARQGSLVSQSSLLSQARAIIN